MTELYDKEFGPVTIRRSHLSRSVRLSIAPNGLLRISMPTYAPLFLAKRLLASSRGSIREMLQSEKSTIYTHAQQIGKSHSLDFVDGATLSAKRQGQRIMVQIPLSSNSEDANVQRVIKDAVITALRREATSYLPKRLAFLAAKYGYSYQKTRFSHASSRWGSCTSQGTISLNIALMRLPFELIDYVLIHELCHTKQMNHSQAFWSLVEQCDPDYAYHKKQLRAENPTVL